MRMVSIDIKHYELLRCLNYCKGYIANVCESHNFKEYMDELGVHHIKNQILHDVKYKHVKKVGMSK